MIRVEDLAKRYKKAETNAVEGISFHNGGSEVFVGEDAHLVYGTLQDWGRNVFHYSNQRARIDARSLRSVTAPLAWTTGSISAIVSQASQYRPNCSSSY